MSAAVAIVAWLGLLLSAVASRLLFGKTRKLPEDGRAGIPEVSVIIPARDEQPNLGKLLPALGHQTVPPCEIIVVDDQSSDGTARMARDAGAKVVEGRPLPEEWFGKPWACWQGAEVARGEWLLFLDADVEPAPDFLARMAACMEEERSVVSVCPWHRIERPYEELSVFFNLLMVGGIGASTWRGDRAPGIGLFGQTLLIPRAIYDEVGGHSVVKRTVLENFHLSKKLATLGVRRVCRVGQGSIAMRMFPEGYERLRDGWSKGFASGAALSARGTLVLSSVWLAGLTMVTVSMALMPLLDGAARVAAGLAYLFAGLLLMPLFRKVGRFSWWNAMAFPVSLLFYKLLFLRAVWRNRSGGTTRWKGRDVA